MYRQLILLLLLFVSSQVLAQNSTKKLLPNLIESEKLTIEMTYNEDNRLDTLLIYDSGHKSTNHISGDYKRYTFQYHYDGKLGIFSKKSMRSKTRYYDVECENDTILFYGKYGVEYRLLLDNSDRLLHKIDFSRRKDFTYTRDSIGNLISMTEIDSIYHEGDIRLFKYNDGKTIFSQINVQPWILDFIEPLPFFIGNISEIQILNYKSTPSSPQKTSKPLKCTTAYNSDGYPITIQIKGEKEDLLEGEKELLINVKISYIEAK